MQRTGVPRVKSARHWRSCLKCGRYLPCFCEQQRTHRSQYPLHPECLEAETVAARVQNCARDRARHVWRAAAFRAQHMRLEARQQAYRGAQARTPTWADIVLGPQPSKIALGGPSDRFAF